MAIIVGSLYIPNWNNINWTQPGGVGTQVFPAQERNQPFTAYPVIGQVIDEVGQALWQFGCGHGADTIRVFHDYLPVSKISIAVIACPICSYVINGIVPYEAAFDPIQFPIIIASSVGGFGQGPFGIQQFT